MIKNSKKEGIDMDKVILGFNMVVIILSIPFVFSATKSYVKNKNKVKEYNKKIDKEENKLGYFSVKSMMPLIFWFLLLILAYYYITDTVVAYGYLMLCIMLSLLIDVKEARVKNYIDERLQK